LERFAVGVGVHPLKPGCYRFCFTRYQYRFKRAIQTRYGVWQVREGVTLQLIDATGQTSWGEIAPIPWFSSETLEQALEFCDRLPAELTEATIFSIPNHLPACQFGFESALGGVKADGSSPTDLAYSRLLPAGKAALQNWQTLWNQGYCTFKWKIGVFPIAEELEIFHQLIQALPPAAKLRLDANGGLGHEAANQWLTACDAMNGAQHSFAEVEYIEQPLPPQQFEQMQELSLRYAVPIALDESVATLQDLQTCYERGWRGVFVIKPAIVGSPTQLRQFCQTHPIDAVFSTAFETLIGRRSGLQLAAELSNRNRAVAYDGNWSEFDYLDFSLKEYNSLL
jgi:O-succinylbenzoate synthase